MLNFFIQKIGLKSGWLEKASPTTFSPSPTSPTKSGPSPEPAARKIGLARSGFGRPDPIADPCFRLLSIPKLLYYQSRNLKCQQKSQIPNSKFQW